MSPEPDNPPAGKALDWIPRDVRDKLDRVGIKVHLRDWKDMTIAERKRLCDLPCFTAEEATRYAAEVERLVLRVTGALPERLPPKVGV
jgi:hypothetical protein